MKGYLRLAVLGLLVGITPLEGQQVSGALEGRVVTAQGEPIEGVQIAIQGEALQRSRTASTDPRGHFVIQSLPGGSYVVTLRRIGYGPIRVQDVPIQLGSTTSLGDVKMTQQAVDVAEISVSGARPVIDPVSPATGATLDSSQLLSLPVQRDFRSLIPLVPQANATPFGDGTNISGATGLENAFYVDGMDVTVSYGTSVDLPFNFIRQIHVATGGYEAEYGRALSGVVNVVTQSGGNQFHGQALAFYTGDELRSSPKAGLAQIYPVNYAQYDFGLSLSGPIRHDRLWYFAAYDPTHVDQDAAVGGVKERDTQVHHLLAGKLSWSPNERTDAVLTLLGDPYSHDTVESNVLPATTSPSAALGHATGGGSTIALQLRHSLDPRTELHASVSRLDRRNDVAPRAGGTGLAAVTRLDDFTTNASSGGIGGVNRNKDARTAVRLALSLQRGVHSVKLGAEYEDNSFTTSGFLSSVTRVADSVYDWLIINQTAQVHNHVPAMYGQDAWELTPRLRVNLGLRWEAQYISGRAGPNRTIPVELAPRLGAVYELGPVGTQRLFANAGRFFEQVVPYSVTVWNGSFNQLVREYRQNPLVDSTNAVFLGQLDITAGAPRTTGLIGQSYDQVSLGYERRVGSSLKFGALGTYRMLRWVLEDGIAPGDSVYRMGNPGRGPLATMPRARQRYAALELRVERSTPGPLYVLASYVLSRNVGNYTGLFSTDFQVPLPNAGPQYDFPDVMVDAYGRLPNDRTHVFKSAVSYRFGFGTTIGGFLTVASGLPRSELGTSAYGFPYWTFIRPRGTAGQTPAIWSLDLHGAYDFPGVRGGRVRPKLLIDVFNVGSPRQPLLYDQRHYLDNARAQSNPNYGSVTQYQTPMNARVGMVFDF